MGVEKDAALTLLGLAGVIAVLLGLAVWVYWRNVTKGRW